MSCWIAEYRFDFANTQLISNIQYRFPANTNQIIELALDGNLLAQCLPEKNAYPISILLRQPVQDDQKGYLLFTYFLFTILEGFTC